MMTSEQMIDIRKDLTFLIDSIRHLRANDPPLKAVLESLCSIDNKLIDIQDADMGAKHD